MSDALENAVKGRAQECLRRTATHDSCLCERPGYPLALAGAFRTPVGSFGVRWIYGLQGRGAYHDGDNAGW